MNKEPLPTDFTRFALYIHQFGVYRWRGRGIIRNKDAAERLRRVMIADDIRRDITPVMWADYKDAGRLAPDDPGQPFRWFVARHPALVDRIRQLVASVGKPRREPIRRASLTDREAAYAIIEALAVAQHPNHETGASYCSKCGKADYAAIETLARSCGMVTA